MRVLIAAIAALYSLAGYAFQNEPDGFRGIKWASEASAYMAELEPLGEDEFSFYRRKGDNYSIGGAKLADIAYGFWDGRFYGVNIKARGQENNRALVAAVIAQFGEPTESNKDATASESIWGGETTNILLQCDKLLFFCSLTMWSTQLDKEKVVADRAAAKERRIRERQAAESAGKDF